jgi:hypothetical protein
MRRVISGFATKQAWAGYGCRSRPTLKFEKTELEGGRESNRDCADLAGTKLAATVWGGEIYISSDSGVNWTVKPSGSRQWNGLASSADGTRLAATVWGGQPYTSECP